MNIVDLAILKKMVAGGGGSGTDNYNDLSNLPQINGETLAGNKTAANLGLQDALTFDSAPTEDSTNPVESGGVYTALAGKQDNLTFDDDPTENSTNPVKSGGVYSALAGKQDNLTFDGVYNASTNKAATESTVTNAIAGLDVSAFSVDADETISSISETDGKISVTKQDIAIASNQVVAMTGYTKPSSAPATPAIQQADTANTAFGKLEYKADVNQTNILSTQESTIGENLIPYPYNYAIRDVRGIVYAPDSDGVITCVGTNDGTDNNYYFLALQDSTLGLEEGQTYTMSAVVEGTGSVKSVYLTEVVSEGDSPRPVYFENVTAGSYSQTFTFTTPENFIGITVAIGILKADTSAKNLKFKIMLEKGSVAHPYQPYKLSRQNLYNESYQTAILSDKIVRLTENKDGYAYITSTAGEVIKSVGKNLADYNVYPYHYQSETLTIDTTVASDGKITIDTAGTTKTSNSQMSAYFVTIAVDKPCTIIVRFDHISGIYYKANDPTTAISLGHQIVFTDVNGDAYRTTYSGVDVPADVGVDYREITVTEDDIAHDVCLIKLRPWVNGTTGGGSVVDNFTYTMMAIVGESGDTFNYQSYQESIEVCDSEGHCYIMTYEDGSVYSRDNYYTKTISVNYPESDFALTYNECAKKTNPNVITYNLNNGVKNLLNLSNVAPTVPTGLTCTDNGDGTYTVSGTLTSSASIKFDIPYIPGTLILSGCPEGGSLQNGYVIRVTHSPDGTTVDATDSGEGSQPFTMSTEETYNMRFRFVAGTYTNLLFKPMIRVADISDATYQQYAKSNAELTKAVSTTAPALSTSTAIDTGSLDDITINTFAVYASTVSNLPTSDDYYVETIIYDSSNALQKAYSCTDGTSYIRVKATATWGNWKQITNA